MKTVEEAVGFRPTRDFARSDPRITAYYRCYYTGTRQLPASYDQLKLREGNESGCPVDPNKFDVFFYKIEAVASGRAPVTQSLAAASAERIATVVPHEDFHEQLKQLPDTIAEAAATLIGFLTAAKADGELSAEAGLFREKALLINRSYEHLAALYRTERDRRRALEEKEKTFAALQSGCAAIPPARTFNRCVSAANNAGLAFDHSYTEYYPLLYQVYEACGRNLPCAIARIENAPNKKREADLVRYFEDAASGPR